MRFLTLASLALVSTETGVVLCYPGMDGKLMADLKLQARQSPGPSTELLGDLATLPDGKLTPVGKDLKLLLSGGGSPLSDETYGYSNVPPINSKACRQDTCCIWKHIADTMHGLFQGKSGRCTKWARYAVRLGFHDAGGWSKPTAAQGGGADGSIILSGVEMGRKENLGLDDIFDKMQDWYKQFHTQLGYPISMADLIQMGATVAAVTCPLGPRVKSYVGRKDSTTPAPQLLPDVNADADSLLQLFKDKTVSPFDLAALLGAHTTSQQEFVDPSRELAPQDSTPGVWDTLFYNQTLGKANGGTDPPKRVMKFHSDVVLSTHPAVSGTWHSFASAGGQTPWNFVSVPCLSCLISAVSFDYTAANYDVRLTLAHTFG